MRKPLLLFLLALSAPALFAGEAMTWIYRHGGDTHMRSVNDRAPDPDALARRYGGEFVWIRRAGQAYVITDRTVLASIRKAFVERDEFNEKFDAVHERLDERAQEIDAIGDELDDDGLSDAERHRIEERLHAAEERLHAVERELHDIESDMRDAENASENELMHIIERAITEGKAERG